MLDNASLPIGTPEHIEVGMVWLESIDNILTKYSIDGADPTMEADSDDEEWDMSWTTLLDTKRMDDNYADIRDSIIRKGFVRPLTVEIDGNDFLFGDGHHRLAAAIELGFSAIPVEAFVSGSVSTDSGSWRTGDPIPTGKSEEPLYYGCQYCDMDFDDPELRDMHEFEYEAEGARALHRLMNVYNLF